MFLSFNKPSALSSTFESNNASSIVFTMTDFDDLIYSAIDQSFSFFFMATFILLILLIVGFSIKSDWKTLKKSQKNIILMILTLLTTQMIGLSGRTSYNFIDISILTRYENYLTENGYTENDQLYIDVIVNGNDTYLTTDMVGIPYADVVGLFLSKSIEAFFILFGLVIINMVLHYISHLFFNLIKYSQGVLKSNRTRVIRMIFDTVMFITYFFYFLLLTAIFIL